MHTVAKYCRQEAFTNDYALNELHVCTMKPHILQSYQSSLLLHTVLQLCPTVATIWPVLMLRSKYKKEHKFIIKIVTRIQLYVIFVI